MPCAPKVSVCVPVYNAEKYIEQCARSLFEQTLDDIEYVFVDDCSPDRSVEILQEVLKDYSRRNSQIKIVHHSTNCGPLCARNTALTHASGEYVIYCDSDDWVEPDMYERMYRKIKDSDADMAYCCFFRESLNGTRKIIPCPTELLPQEMIHGFFSGKIHGGLWNKLYRRDLLETFELDLPAEICMCEDVRLNVQLLLHCKKIVSCSEPLYHYRENPQSLSSKRDIRSFWSEVSNYMLYEKILDDECYGAVLDNCKRRILMECLLADAIPAARWHSLWKRAKRGMLTANYPFKLKMMFYLACCNYSLASWLLRKIKRRRMRIRTATDAGGKC